MVLFHSQLYKVYPEKKLAAIKTDETTSVLVKAASIKTAELKDILEKRHNVSLLKSDVHNFRRKFLGVDSDSASCDSFASEIRANGGFAEIGRSESGDFRHFLFYTNNMQAIFQRYPETVIMDVTYRTNKYLYPLLTAMVIDYDGHGIPIMHAYLSKEDTGTIEHCLRVFSEKNSFSRTHCFMVDKDMAEIAALGAVFPGIPINLCHFHIHQAVKRAMKNKVPADAVDKIVDLFMYQVYTESEEEFLEVKNKIIDMVPEEASDYFRTHWWQKSHLWAASQQINIFKLDVNTTNHLESYHNKIKANLNEKVKLSKALSLLLSFDNNKILESNKLLLIAANTVSYDQRDRDGASKIITKTLSKMAARLVKEQLQVARKTSYIINACADSLFTISYREKVYQGNRNLCNCSFFLQMGLPCRHIFALRRFLDLPEVDCDELAAHRFSYRRIIRDLPEALAGQETGEMITVQDNNPSVSTVEGRYLKAKNVCQKFIEHLSVVGSNEFQDKIKQLEDLLQMWCSPGESDPVNSPLPPEVSVTPAPFANTVRTAQSPEESAVVTELAVNPSHPFTSSFGVDPSNPFTSEFAVPPRPVNPEFALATHEVVALQHPFTPEVLSLSVPFSLAAAPPTPVNPECVPPRLVSHECAAVPPRPVNPDLAAPPRPVNPEFTPAPPRPVNPELPRPVNPEFGPAPPRPMNPEFAAAPPRPVNPEFTPAPPRPMNPEFGPAPPRPVNPEFTPAPPRPVNPEFVAAPPGRVNPHLAASSRPVNPHLAVSSLSVNPAFSAASPRPVNPDLASPTCPVNHDLAAVSSWPVNPDFAALSSREFSPHLAALSSRPVNHYRVATPRPVNPDIAAPPRPVNPDLADPLGAVITDLAAPPRPLTPEVVVQSYPFSPAADSPQPVQGAIAQSRALTQNTSELAVAEGSSVFEVPPVVTSDINGSSSASFSLGAGNALESWPNMDKIPRPRGRPCSKQNFTRRKMTLKRKRACPKKFEELSEDAKAALLIQATCESEALAMSTITESSVKEFTFFTDFVMDMRVDVAIVKQHFESFAFDKLSDGIFNRRQSNIFSCGKCGEIDDLSQKMVMCEQCLLWFHFQCAGYRSKMKIPTWFCKSCMSGDTLTN
ncbi:LOW QUALITY PROTEIN: zinc finger SWIM domain-containing protein 1 [Elysia marginata]|uniref:Zinc finger SWIM domain-containing protein 1 n=1 Tax=Elysia marginata TaxID=1093978 RepID=A0AAV4FDB7_9GAST|nr:LOW QUALITY PROTEIN: zinc finger SWIM domain-containing protein 1 [Elysia marginata]